MIGSKLLKANQTISKELLEIETGGGNMTPKDYRLLVRCVEDGVAYGYNRAHKHTESPSEDMLKAKIEDAVLAEISEWFDFAETAKYEREPY